MAAMLDRGRHQSRHREKISKIWSGNAEMLQRFPALLPYVHLRSSLAEESYNEKLPVKLRAAKRKLHGPWTDGYALDVHTVSSTMTGHNEYGHTLFDISESTYALRSPFLLRRLPDA
jgi:hypothetical protein